MAFIGKGALQSGTTLWKVNFFSSFCYSCKDQKVHSANSPQDLGSAVTPTTFEEEVRCKVWSWLHPLPPTRLHRWTWSYPLCCSACLSRCPSGASWWCWWHHQSRQQRWEPFTQGVTVYFFHFSWLEGADSCNVCVVLPWVSGSLCHKGLGQSQYGRELCHRSVPDRSPGPPGSALLAGRKHWTQLSHNLSVQTQQSRWNISNLSDIRESERG